MAGRAWARTLALLAAAYVTCGFDPNGEPPEAFREPPGLVWGKLALADGKAVRWVHWPPDGGGPAAATVVMVHGYSGYLERYYENMREFRARGFDVWGMDWPGMGGSDRYQDNPQKGHIADFAVYLEALDRFRRAVVKPAGPGPVVVFGQSMGGHVILRYLAEQPNQFDLGLVLAPMIDINTAPWPRGMASALSRTMAALGFAGDYAAGAGDWKKNPARTLESNPLTHDALRYPLGDYWRRVKPELTTWGQTWGWLAAAFRSMDDLAASEVLGSIRTPILMVTAGDERVVVADAQFPACRAIPHCRLLYIPESRHVPFEEIEPVRDAIWAAFDQMLAQQKAGVWSRP